MSFRNTSWQPVTPCGLDSTYGPRHGLGSHGFGQGLGLPKSPGAPTPQERNAGRSNSPTAGERLRKENSKHLAQVPRNSKGSRGAGGFETLDPLHAMRVWSGSWNHAVIGSTKQSRLRAALLSVNTCHNLPSFIGVIGQIGASSRGRRPRARKGRAAQHRRLSRRHGQPYFEAAMARRGRTDDGWSAQLSRSTTKTNPSENCGNRKLTRRAARKAIRLGQPAGEARSTL